MFQRAISFTVTYFPEDGRVRVSCLNAPDSLFITVIGVLGDVSGVSSAAANGICAFMKENQFEDFFEVK